MDKHSSQSLTTVKPLKENTSGVSQEGGKLEMCAHSSTHSCPTIDHPFVAKGPPVLVLVHSKLLEPDIAHLTQP